MRAWMVEQILGLSIVQQPTARPGAPRLGWGDDPRWVWFKNAETLYKRGSSGVQTLRARGGFEYAVPIGAPATETGTKYSMSNANEEWGLYEVGMARPEPETLA
jgi:hypothetical protein